jgi:2-dehydropantoate 2-reductase
VGEARVVPSIVYFNGERLAADHMRIWPIGDADLAVENDEDGRQFAALFDRSRIRVQLSDDFLTLVWRKLLVNAIANPITALTSRRQEVLRETDIQELCVEALAEVTEIGRAEGAKLVAGHAQATLASLLKFSPEAGTSMYFDRMNGRRLEVDAITGWIVSAAKRHDIPAPISSTLLALLRAINEAPDK